MTNGEKYKTPQERYKAFRKFCDKHICDDNLCDDECPCHKSNFGCHFPWLALESEVEKPLPCPFCGGEAEVSEGYSVMPKGVFVQCKHCWAFVAGFKTKTDAIAAWNRRVK